MGYSTDFKGSLKFDCVMTAPDYKALNAILGEDVRHHADWPKTEHTSDFCHIDLEINEDFDGIKWNDSEKSYLMHEQVNYVILMMQRDKPDFCLSGQMFAQGEDPDDRWTLVMKDNVAVKRECAIPGSIYRCPHCNGKVIIDEAEKIQ